MIARIVAEAAGLVTIEWDPVPGVGYRFLRDGAYLSHTWDPSRTRTTFRATGKQHVFEVQALVPDVARVPWPDVPADAWAAAVAAFAPPAFTPARTVLVSTPGELRQAVAALRAGDLIKAKVGFVDVGGTLHLPQLQLSSPARLDMSGITLRTGAAGSLEHALTIRRSRNLQIVGDGTVTARGNSGVWIEDSDDIVVWGPLIRDCAGTGMMVQGINRPQTGLRVYVRVTNCGVDYRRLDPHAEKGTGVHGVYLGGANHPSSGSFALDVYDQHTGAAVQAGAHLERAELAVRAKRITFEARSQVAGNALQLWGSCRSVTVTYLEAEDVARAVETDGLYGDATGIVVGTDKKVTRARLPQPFRPHPAVTYR